MPFRYQFIVAFILVEAVFVLVIVAFNFSSFKGSSDALIQSQIASNRLMLSQIVKLPLIVNDLATLDDAVKNFASLSNVVEAEVLNSRGKLLSIAHSSNPNYQPLLKELHQKADLETFYAQSQQLVDQQKHLLFVQQKVMLGNEALGSVRFIFDVTDTKHAISENLWITIALASMALLLGIATSLLLGARITRSMQRLIDTARKIAQGKPIDFKPQQASKDEIDQLSDAMRVMQQDIHNRNQRLIEAEQKALKASQAKSEFLAIMSHEIRTPLNGIIGTLSLVESQALDVEHQSHYEMVKSSSEMLLAVINDILDYSKIEAGRLSIDQQPINFTQILTSVEKGYRHLIESKGLQFEVDLSALKQPLFIGDEIRIKQILNNYLNNAIKFTEEGTIKLTARNQNNGEIYIGVQDSGIGIHRDKISMLFQDFNQVSQGANRQYGGTGLGLAISKKLAKLMNGRVDVESRYGQGSIFGVAFRLPPAEPSELNEHTQTSSPLETMDLSPLAKKQILLVEDNKINQIVATKILNKAGCVVTVANNGVEAVNAVQKTQFDLILMDCHMPVMDGFEATKQIRYAQKQIPIIALTANTQLSDRDQCIQVGMNGFISKPFKPETLYSEMLTLINVAATGV